MTALGFCVVAALSSHTSGRPFTRSCRIGKSRRMKCASNGTRRHSNVRYDVGAKLQGLDAKRLR